MIMDAARTRRRIAAIAMVALMAMPMATTAAKAEKVSLTAPNGGETWMGHSAHDITWTPSTTGGVFNLTLSTDGGLTYPQVLAGALTGKAKYTWTVPNNINSTTCRVKVTWTLGTFPDYQTMVDESDSNFTIRRSITVEFVHVNDTMSSSRYYLLTWRLSDGLQRVRSLDLQFRSKVGTATTYGPWVTQGPPYDSIPTTSGGMWWMPPYYELAKGQLKLRARAGDAARTVLAEADSIEFDIKSPIIFLDSPNGGETLVAGVPYDVAWRISNDRFAEILDVVIRYSLDGGHTFPYYISSGTSKTSPFRWTPPSGIDSTAFRVNVSARVNTPEWHELAWDFSDNDCNLISSSATHTVTLVDPDPAFDRQVIVNGTENYHIRWRTTGSVSDISTFKVYLSTDSGATYTHFHDSPSFTAGYIWNVPSIDTTTARVRVECVLTAGDVLSDASDRDFIISTNISYNQPPVALVVPATQTATEGTEVSLDSSESWDREGDPLTFRWRQVGATSFPVEWRANTLPVAKLVTKVRDFEVLLEFELSVTDGHDHDELYMENVAYASVRVLPLPPTLTSAYPLRVWEGLPVTIKGANLMGGQVLIGDVPTGTVPTSLIRGLPDPDVEYTFTIAPGVPHGKRPVVVRDRAGEASTTGTIEVFPKPVWCLEHGLPFHNPSKGSLSYPWDFTDDGAYKDTFGSDDVYLNIWICIGLPWWDPWDGWVCLGWDYEQPICPDPFAALFYGAGYWYLARNGECYGMSSVALQLYHGEYLPGDLDPAWHGVDDVNQSGMLERRIDWLHGSQVSAEALHCFIGSHIDALYPSADLPPMGLGLFLAEVRAAVASGELGAISMMNGASGHVVVPYLVEDVDATHTRIYVYDPNREEWSREGSALALIYNDSNPRNNYPPYIEITKEGIYWDWTFQWPDAPAWGGEVGIIFIPYDLLNGPRTMPLSLDGVYDLVMGSATSSVEDTDGHSIGVAENGSVVNTFPNASFFPVLGGRDADARRYWLPRGNYTTRITGTGEGTYNWSVLCDGLGAYALEGAGVKTGSHDTATVNYQDGNPYRGGISYRTSDAQKTYTASQVKRFASDGNDRQRVYRVRNATLFGDSEAIINTTPDYGALVFTNNGPHTFTFDVEFQGNVVSSDAVNRSGMPTGLPTATRRGITILPYQTLVIRPSSWLDLMHANVTIEGEVVKMAPGIPTNLKATSPGGKVELSWTVPASSGGSPITGYVVLRGESEGVLVVYREVGNVTSFTDDAVADNTTYWYAVLARNAVGQGVRCAAVSVATPEAVPTGGDGKEKMPPWLIPLVIVIAILAAVGVAAMMMRGRGKAPVDAPMDEGAKLERATVPPAEVSNAR
jgi:hypothetical protein